jgi:hybrid polyketide synthase / nonribosomal peptide synthetase ACE1
VYRVLLCRLLKLNDLCIGFADANRTDTDTLNSIGFFLNLLPLRFRLDKKQSFADGLLEARTKVRSALAHSRVPFDVLLDQLDAPRSASHSPVFQAFIDYRPPILEKKTFSDCKIGEEDYEIGRAGYDLTLDIVDTVDGNALILFLVQQNLYSKKDADILMKSYINLLEEFSTNPTADTDQPSLFSKSSKENAIQLGRGELLPMQILRQF